MAKKKVLILGPIGDFGGRELEAGFIASTLAKKYNVHVVSTESFSLKSQLLDFKNFSFETLNDILLKKYFFIKVFSFIVRILKKSNNKYYFLQSPFFKKKFKIEQKKEKALKKVILGVDAVFIIAQVTSTYLKYIVEFSKNSKKIIFFRTTGNIINTNNFNYLSKVDLFIHHSLTNAKNINFNHNYKIIDQCSFHEKQLLNIPIIKSEIHNFLVICRLEKQKEVDVVIRAFLKGAGANNKLYIVGDGKDLSRLKSLSNDKRIIFTGFLDNNSLVDIFRICQCFIVPYYKLEAGPITAIEAMASGLTIISSKTGAMPDRFNDSEILWHDNSVNDLTKKIELVRTYDEVEIEKKSNFNKKKYLLQYKKDIIQQKYLDCLKELV